MIDYVRENSFHSPARWQAIKPASNSDLIVHIYLFTKWSDTSRSQFIITSESIVDDCDDDFN